MILQSATLSKPRRTAVTLIYSFTFYLRPKRNAHSAIVWQGLNSPPWQCFVSVPICQSAVPPNWRHESGTSSWKSSAGGLGKLLLREKSLAKKEKVSSLRQLSAPRRAVFHLVWSLPWRLREPVCAPPHPHPESLTCYCLACLLVFISNGECLLFCIYNACSLWGCYRCLGETPYQSLPVATRRNCFAPYIFRGARVTR